MDTNTLFTVKNRSASRVCYTIPEAGIRRTFAPGESKQLPYDELLKLSYQPGGREMMVSFLQIKDVKALRDLNIKTQPEYDMSEAQIKNLLLTGSLDAFLDCLDFAPVGVIDLIKTYSVKLPLTDLYKRKALKDKTGFDVDKAIANDEADKAVESGDVAAAPTGRRTNVSYREEAPVQTEARRTAVDYTAEPDADVDENPAAEAPAAPAAPKYKVVG